MRKKVLALFLAGILLSGCSSHDDPVKPQNSADTSETSEYLSGNSAEHTSNAEADRQDIDNGDFVFIDYDFDEDL